MSSIRERGFSAVELIIGLFVIAAIVGVGWLAYDRMKDDKKNDTATTTQETSDETTAPAVNSTEDLDKATKTLDDTDLDTSTSDSTELDTQTSAF